MVADKPQMQGSDAAVYRRLLGLLHPFRTVVAVTIIAMVVDAACMTLFARVIKPLIDKLFVTHDPHVIFWMPIIGTITSRASDSFQFVHSITPTRPTTVRPSTIAVLAESVVACATCSLV